MKGKIRYSREGELSAEKRPNANKGITTLSPFRIPELLKAEAVQYYRHDFLSRIDCCELALQRAVMNASPNSTLNTSFSRGSAISVKSLSPISLLRESSRRKLLGRHVKF